MEDFRRETIYFIVVDRFCNGVPANDRGMAPDQFDPTHTDWQLFWGGDLEGVIQKLDYVFGMGARAIWITPVFQQVQDLVIENGVRRAPYHGYWAQDFKRIDERLCGHPDNARVFARDDTVFDRLVGEVHRRGGKLVLDIVCNHSSPHLVGGRGVLYDDGVRVASYEEDGGIWYHHMGDVKNWSDLSEVQTHDLCDLSDFNEESYAYRCYIKGAIKQWLDKGVDGLRVDTVKHMPLWFWQEFVSDMRCHKPGVFMFGEWFLGGVHDPDSLQFVRTSGMSMIDFSLRQAMVGALAYDSGRGFEDVADVFAKDNLLPTASELVTFVDNHDLPRFLSMRDDQARFRLANVLVMTARGIPCIYYGSEQLLHDDTAGGGDPYNRPMMTRWDRESPLYVELRRLADLRRDSVAVQKGGMFMHSVTPDVLVFTRRYEGAVALVALNRGAPVDLPVIDVPLADGHYRCVLSGRDVRVQQGRTMLTLGRDDALVVAHTPPLVHGKARCEFQLNGLATAWGEQVFLVGDCEELAAWDYNHAVAMEYVNANTWCTDVPFTPTCGKEFAYKYFVRDASGVRRELALPRRRYAPQTGYRRFRDDWSAHLPE